jgi:hypothetical protein
MVFPPLQPLNTPNSNATDAIKDFGSNVTTNPDPFANNPNTSYPAINKIEKSLYGRVYTSEDISTRLSRIERTMFTTTYPSTPNGQRIDNIISNFNQINKVPNISSNGLSRMESKIFNQTYTNNSAQNRVERLEQQLFGTVQSGDLEARYRALQVATANINKMNQSQRGLRGFTNSLGNSFWGGGSMTGFTPPLDDFSDFGNDMNNTTTYNNNFNSNYGTNYGTNSYNNQNNAYGNNTYPRNNALNSLMLGGSYPTGSGIYRGYRTMHGYGDSYRNYGTGSSVTILD